jgi:hypothetical protein
MAIRIMSISRQKPHCLHPNVFDQRALLPYADHTKHLSRRSAFIRVYLKAQKKFRLGIDEI